MWRCVLVVRVATLAWWRGEYSARPLWSISMLITPDNLARFRHLRHHGASLETAARKADLTLDEAHKTEGRHYCPSCPAETSPFDGAYVPRNECPHWDYETL